MKLCLVVFLCLIVGTLALPGVGQIKDEWNRFKSFHKKAYRGVAEDLFRLKVFLKNKLAVLAHNLNFRRGKVTYVAGMNNFGDLLGHEYNKFSSGIKRALVSKFYGKTAYVRSFLPIPPSVDLRTKNLVVPPRAQGQCAGSWAFSATGAIEGQLAKKTGRLVPLSQQHLIDCSKENDGCVGGWVGAAFYHLERNGGSVAESSYPYSGNAGQCRFNPRSVVAKVTGSKDIRPGKPEDLQDAIAQVGPIAIAIDASSHMLSFYKSGIFAPSLSECRWDNANHAALAVGYGSENGKNYWLIKNSYGPGWGEGGYIRILRSNDDLCGVTSKPTFPTL